MAHHRRKKPKNASEISRKQVAMVYSGGLAKEPI